MSAVASKSCESGSLSSNKLLYHDDVCCEGLIANTFGLIGLSVSSVSIATWTVFNINCDDYKKDQCSKGYTAATQK